MVLCHIHTITIHNKTTKNAQTLTSAPPNGTSSQPPQISCSSQSKEHMPGRKEGASSQSDPPPSSSKALSDPPQNPSTPHKTANPKSNFSHHTQLQSTNQCFYLPFKFLGYQTVANK